MKKLLTISLVVSSLLTADTSVELLKKQMDKQQLIIETLQAKIEKLEKNDVHNEQAYIRNITMPSHETDEHKPNIAHVKKVQSTTFGQSKYIPDISLVADFSGVARSKKDDEVAHLEIPGVVHGLLGSSSEDGHEHGSNNAKNGFNFFILKLLSFRLHL